MKKKYNTLRCHPGCPVEATLHLIGGKWKGIILYHLLLEDVLRFSVFTRLLPSINQRMLTKQLRELEASGLILRTVYPVVPPKVEYTLTPPWQVIRIYPAVSQRLGAMNIYAKSTKSMYNENELMKVWSIELPKGAVMPFHKHNKPYFYTAVTAGDSRSFLDNGIVIETIYEKGDIKYFDDISETNSFTHNLENIGETTLIFTTVEFKK